MSNRRVREKEKKCGRNDVQIIWGRGIIFLNVFPFLLDSKKKVKDKAIPVTDRGGP
jgi:hypothetical protein